jgi:hypothetical protein
MPKVSRRREKYYQKSHLQKSEFQIAAPPHSSAGDGFSVSEMIARPRG